MALKFGSARGSGKSSKLDYYKVVEGDNTVRLVGGIRARYLYWLKGANGSPIPFECLAFNPETEEFDNKEIDWVKEFYPDVKCQWSYVSLCIADGKIQPFNHKKKMFANILVEAKDLGDPTDPDNGWDLQFSRNKTGPLPINVEYSIRSRKLVNRALTDEEKALIAESPTIDEMIPRETAADQKKRLERLRGDSKENIDEEVDSEFENV